MRISTQHTLKHKRPPRVKITYDLEIGGAFIVKELPYVFGVLSDLSGHSQKQPLKTRNFIEIDGGNFSEVMLAIKPSLSLNILNKFGPGNTKVDLEFKELDDFLPSSIIAQNILLKTAFSKINSLNDFLAKIEANEDLLSAFSNLVKDKTKLISLNSSLKDGLQAKIDDKLTLNDLLVNNKFDMQNNGKVQAMLDLLNIIIPTLSSNVSDDEKSIVTLIKRCINSINTQMSAQLDEIIHNKEFLQLEGAWRGLAYLIANPNTGSNIKIRVFNASKDELLHDFQHSLEFDLSVLFKKVYEEEYGTFGGNPYSCLVMDYYFGRSNQDMELLRHISQVVCAAHVPTIGGVDPDMFDMESFSTLNQPRDLAQLFESSELGAWKGLRETEESRYISLTLPRILVRLPYGQDSNPVKNLTYNETIDPKDDNQFCWANASYALARKIISAATIYNWTTAIRGVDGGGVVGGLAVYSHKTPEGDVVVKCPTEVPITDRREQELSKLGFIPLCHCRGTDYAVFFGAQTVQHPDLYSTEEATANSELSAKLHYMLAASRFAHYIKAIMRDRIGSSLSKTDIELELNNWLAKYILLSDNAGQDIKARFPLREGRVEVSEDEANPGSYSATVYLRPHFQLEEMDVSIRLVAKLPMSK